MSAEPKPVTVVVGWMLANLVLAGLLVAFRASAFEFVLYFASAAPITVLSVVLWRLAAEEGYQPDRLVLPGRSGPVVVVSAAVTVIGLGLIFGPWLSMIGTLLLIGAITTLVRRRGVRHDIPELRFAEPARTPTTVAASTLIGRAVPAANPAARPSLGRIAAAMLLAGFANRLLRRWIPWQRGSRS
jgi:hypothetical protein